MAWNPSKTYQSVFGKPQTTYKTTGTKYTRGDYKKMAYYDNAFKSTSDTYAKEYGIDPGIMQRALGMELQERENHNSANYKRRQSIYEDNQKDAEKFEKKEWKSIQKDAEDDYSLADLVKSFEKDRGGNPLDPYSRADLAEYQRMQDYKSNQGKALKKQVDSINAITKKTKDKGIFDDLKAVGKSAYQFFNPFDDVSGKEAVDNFINRDFSDGFKETDRFASRSLDSMTGKAFSNLDKKVNDKIPDYTSYRKFGEGGGTDMIADGLGYLVPGIGAYKVLNATKAGKALTQFGSKGVGQRLASEGIKGAVTGAGVAAGEVGSRMLNPDDYSLQDNLKHIGFGAATGAIADPALYGLGKVAGNTLSKFAKGNVPQYTGQIGEETLSTLAPPKRSLQPDTGKSDALYDQLISVRKPKETMSKLADLEAAPAKQMVEPKPMKEKYEPITTNPDEQFGTKLARADKVQQPPTGGDSASFDAKINRTPNKENKFMDTMKNFRTQFVDDLAPLERLEKSVKGEVGSAEDSLYKTARLIKGSPERAHEIVRSKLGPIINKVQDAGYSEKDLENYALAVHARDVNEKGINSGFSNEEIESVISKLGTDEMEAARKELIKVSDGLLKDELLDSGIITEEAYKAMREKYPNYMPLFRSFDDEKIEFGSGVSKSLANANNPIKKLEGSSRDVVSPLESMVKNVFQSTNVADRNRVGKQLAKLSEQDSQGLVKRLDPSEKVERKNVVSVMENGEKVKYEVPPDIYKTFQNLDKESTNTLVKILQAPASTLRAGATLTPEFSLRNPLRDVAQAYVVSNSGFNPFTDFPMGLVGAITKGNPIKIGNKEFTKPGELYKQFIEDNGGYGNIVSMDRNLHKKSIEKVMKEGNTKKFVNVVNPKQWLEVLRAVADVSETATKMGEYRAARRSGASPQESAYRARDIMDFARAGTSIREANKVVAFLNANIQGKSKLIRAIKEDPKGTTARAFKVVTMPSIGVFMAQKFMANEEQKKTINDAPSWLTESHWLIPIPGTTQIARIPKPFDLAPVFSSPVERFLNYMWDNDKDAFEGYSKEALSSASVPMMMTGLSPLVEGMANYSFFRQGPIIPMRENDVDFPDQYDVNTSETAKFLGKGINKITGGEGAFKNFGSPRIVDNTIRGLTGGLGEYTTDAIDKVVEGVGLVKDAEKPSKQVNQQPLLRSFLVNQASTGESVGKVYDTLDKLKKERGSAKTNGSEFKKEQQYKSYNETAKTISGITKEMRSIENSPELSGDKKRKLLDELNDERNKVAREAMERLKGGK